MKKRFKKVLTVVLALTMMLGAFAVAAFAADTVGVRNVQTELDSEYVKTKIAYDFSSWWNSAYGGSGTYHIEAGNLGSGTSYFITNKTKGQVTACSCGSYVDSNGTCGNCGSAPITNTYARVERDKNTCIQTTSDPYYAFKFGAYDDAWSLLKHQYAMFDIQIGTDSYVTEDGVLTTDPAVSTKLAYSEGMRWMLFGRYVPESGSGNQQVMSQGSSYFYLTYNSSENQWYLKCNWDEEAAYPLSNNIGEWNQITILVDMSDEDISFTLDSSGTKATVKNFGSKAKYHLYVNGDYVSTRSNFLNNPGAGYTADNFVCSAINGYPRFGFDSLRMNALNKATANKESFAICFDNFTATYFRIPEANAAVSDKVADAFSDLAEQTANPQRPIWNVDCAIYNTSYTAPYPNLPAASITSGGTTKNYINVALALAELKEGDTLTINKDYNEPYEIKFPFTLNGSGKLNWYSKASEDDEEPSVYALINGKFTRTTSEAYFIGVSWIGLDGEEAVYELYAPGSTLIYEGESMNKLVDLDNGYFDLQYKGYAEYTLTDEDADEGFVEMYPDATPVFDMQPLFNLTTTTSFTSNFYVPWYANNDDTSLVITVNGVEYTITDITIYDGNTNLNTYYNANNPTPGYRIKYSKVIDGRLYRVATASPGAYENRVNNHKITFKVNGVEVSKSYQFSQIDYINNILKGNYSDSAKALMMQCVNYANEALKVRNQLTNGTAESPFDEILNDSAYAKYLVRTAKGANADFDAYLLSRATGDVTEASAYISGTYLGVNIGSNAGYRPNFVFTVASGIEVDYNDTDKTYAPPYGLKLGYHDYGANKYVTRSISWNKATGRFENGDGMPLYTLMYQYNIVVDNVVVGTYGLADYIKGVEANADLEGTTGVAGSVEVARALYAYAVASYNYKSGNAGVFDYSIAE